LFFILQHSGLTDINKRKASQGLEGDRKRAKTTELRKRRGDPRINLNIAFRRAIDNAMTKPEWEIFDKPVNRKVYTDYGEKVKVGEI